VIEWFTITQVAVACLAGVLCLILGFIGRVPNDFTMGATALVEVLLIVQIVVAIIAPLTGNEPTGDLLEFWVYLISAAILPPLAGFWALIDRSKWSTVILGVVCLAVAVMVWRMGQIWTVQIA
jgi:hypothetical protein